MKKIAIVCVAQLVMFLSGCGSVGVQYKPPIENEDSANLFPAGQGVFINSFDDKGCYSGRTLVEQSVRVHANRDLVLAYDEVDEFKRKYCRILFSLKPEKNANYVVSTEFRGDQCIASVLKNNSKGQTSVEVTPLRLRTGIGCIKAVPLD